MGACMQVCARTCAHATCMHGLHGFGEAQESHAHRDTRITCIAYVAVHHKHWHQTRCKQHDLQLMSAHVITLHCITLHYITLHLHYSTVRCSTLQYIMLHSWNTQHCMMQSLYICARLRCIEKWCIICATSRTHTDMPCHFKLVQFMTYCIMAHHGTARHFTSQHHGTSHHAISRHVLLCHAVTRQHIHTYAYVHTYIASHRMAWHGIAPHRIASHCVVSCWAVLQNASTSPHVSFLCLHACIYYTRPWIPWHDCEHARMLCTCRLWE